MLSLGQPTSCEREAGENGSVDCVDRIVLKAYFRFAQSPAGFGLWWRQLYGTGDDLDNVPCQLHLGARPLGQAAQFRGGTRVSRGIRRLTDWPGSNFTSLPGLYFMLGISLE
jgi:hypothetical protein